MNTKQRTISILILVMSLVISGCGPGQVFGPTLTPTPSPTETSSPTLTPTLTLTQTLTLTSTLTLTPTLTLTSTLTPTDTPTIPCTDKGWSDIDKTMLYVTSSFTGVDKYLNSNVINTLLFIGEELSLQQYVDSISKTDVSPCTQEDLSKIVKGLNTFIDYCKYISAGAEKQGSGQILILPSDINKDKTKAFHEEVKKDFVEANSGLLALNIKLSNLHYLVYYINAVY